MPQRLRERVTIDLRGAGARLHARAAARGISTAALVRHAVFAMMCDEPESERDDLVPMRSHAPMTKVTLRMSALHAVLLATRARSTDVSQGNFVAGLLDGMAWAPKPADHGAAVVALAESTQKVAAMSADIHGFLRLMSGAKSAEAEKFRSGLMSLSDDMRQHLAVASRLMASLTSHPRPGRVSVRKTGTRAE